MLGLLGSGLVLLGYWVVLWISVYGTLWLIGVWVMVRVGGSGSVLVGRR